MLRIVDLLLIDIGVPDYRCMSPEREPQPDYIGQEKEKGCKPAIWSDRFKIESIIESRNLRKVAAATVSAW